MYARFINGEVDEGLFSCAASCDKYRQAFIVHGLEKSKMIGSGDKTRNCVRQLADMSPSSWFIINKKGDRYDRL